MSDKVGYLFDTKDVMERFRGMVLEKNKIINAVIEVLIERVQAAKEDVCLCVQNCRDGTTKYWIEKKPRMNNGLKPCPFCPETTYPDEPLTRGTRGTISCPKCDCSREVCIIDLMSYEEYHGDIGEFSMKKYGGYKPEIQQRAKEFLISEWNKRHEGN